MFPQLVLLASTGANNQLTNPMSHIYSYKKKIHLSGACPHGLIIKVIGCGIVVCEFEI